jgi:Polyprenyl synthetase
MIKSEGGSFDQLLHVPEMASALEVQRGVLREFRERAAAIVGAHCQLRPYRDRELALEKNLFSTLFLAVQRRLGVPQERMLFCGMVSQCMRAWVTGCDNLLDDEFKGVIPFALPEGGHRFESVLTIMAADRICTDLLAEETEAGRISFREAKELSHLTLRALLPSGLQEHEEEPGARVVLGPDELLGRIHAAKTGLLFEAPIAVAEWICAQRSRKFGRARQGLSHFGLACQILDDLVDFSRDMATYRHNFVLSLAVARGTSSCGKAACYRDVVLDSLPLGWARETACQRSAEFFRTSRAGLDEAGMRFTDRGWAAMVRTVPQLLRVPEEVRTLFENAL